MKTILVVDDDILERDTAKDILEDNGYNVLTAGSPRASLKVLEEEQIDLVLLFLDSDIRESV